MAVSETRRLCSILSILDGSLEFSTAFPETYRAPIQPDATALALFSIVMIACGVTLYSTTKLEVLWGAIVAAMALLVITIGSPLEGFELFGPPIALTGGILALADWTALRIASSTVISP
jgi:hypothetical protein